LTGSRAAGLTLIEVVAAIAILGTVLVGIVVAQSRHTHQVARARQQQAAVEAADRLIADWWSSEAGVPIDGEGVISPAGGLRWTTRPVANRPIERLDARVVRVELWPVEEAVQAPFTPPEPLVRVDLVLPRPTQVEPKDVDADRPDAAAADRTRSRREPEAAADRPTEARGVNQRGVQRRDPAASTPEERR